MYPMLFFWGGVFLVYPMLCYVGSFSCVPHAMLCGEFFLCAPCCDMWGDFLVCPMLYYVGSFSCVLHAMSCGEFFL